MSDSQQPVQASGPLEPKKPAFKEQSLPEDLKAVHDELEKVAREYNQAVQSGNKELAAELRVKLESLKKQAHDDSKTHIIAQAGDVYEMWIEIHNDTSRYLRNVGGWDHNHGWWESASVGDIAPGDTAYIHMGGGAMYGLDCVAYFRFDGDSNDTWFQWWFGPYTDPIITLMNCASEKHSYHLDGRIGKFYLGHY